MTDCWFNTKIHWTFNDDFYQVSLISRLLSATIVEFPPTKLSDSSLTNNSKPNFHPLNSHKIK